MTLSYRVEVSKVWNQLGGSPLLLAITTEAHTYEWWLGDSAPWEVTNVGELITAAGVPAVVVGDWAGAITAVAEGLRTGEIPAAADPGHEDDDPGHEDEASVSTSATTTAVVGFVALFVLAGYQFSRRARARQE